MTVAAEHADRMLLDMVTPEQVRELRGKLDAAARAAGRTRPALAAWLPAAVDPGPPAYEQIMRGLVGYLPVRHHQEAFTAAGFGEAVEKARAGASPDELLAALPFAAAGTVGLVGDLAAVRSRIDEYADAGLDEIAVVPATADDPAAERTLTALSR